MDLAPRCLSTNYKHKTSLFDNVSNDMKLSIFSLLPYNDAVNCMLLNKDLQVFIQSIWHRLRKVPIDCLFLFANNIPHRQCAIVLEKTPRKKNVLFVREDRTYALKPCENILELYRKQKLKRLKRKLLVDLPVYRFLMGAGNDGIPLLQNNFAINSMEEGTRLHLDYLLSRINPRCLKLRQDIGARFQLSEILPALKENFRKHGTKVPYMTIHNMNITTIMMDIINILGVSNLSLNNCTFDNEVIRNKIFNVHS